MTEICDYIKVWFAQAAKLVDPASGENRSLETPDSQAEAIVSGVCRQTCRPWLSCEKTLLCRPPNFFGFLPKAGMSARLKTGLFIGSKT